MNDDEIKKNRILINTRTTQKTQIFWKRPWNQFVMEIMEIDIFAWSTWNSRRQIQISPFRSTTAKQSIFFTAWIYVRSWTMLGDGIPFSFWSFLLLFDYASSQ